MPNMLTPNALWNNFDVSLETLPNILDTEEGNGVVYERVNFSGRDSGEGRVQIAAMFAYEKDNRATETVLLFSDSCDTIDKELLALFVKRGYNALMVDYRGEWQGCEFYTKYPGNIAYANTCRCERRKDYVDDSAVETSWYEWVAVGIYAKKYISERTGSNEVAVVGIRDGGEIAWKLAVADSFECIVPVCAAGWKAYKDIKKYLPDEPELDEERYRFIAGIDSQAYAPYVRCPVLMLCSTNDEAFDYDRAYDTFSRINADYIKESAIAYSVQCNACIGVKSIDDMFMFLDKNLKNRQVFIPKPAEVSVEVDEEDNLVAKAIFDDQGIVESCKMFFAEDCLDSSLREWSVCPQKSKISQQGQEFYLNIYEKTSTIFALCYVKYINGFTVWSRIVVKKISGSFRNMQGKCRVMYSDRDVRDGFSFSDYSAKPIGGIFLEDTNYLPRLAEMKDGVKGLYSEHGLTTFRMNSPRFSPSVGNVLKLDIICEKTADVVFVLKNDATGDEFVYIENLLGDVWQSVLIEANAFKNASGASLVSFSSNFSFTINCGVPIAINNVMWL